jgi:acetoin utilization deacetylase AcuC-like enzyme
MTTGLFTHSACLYHELPLGHPESPDRLRAVLHALGPIEALSRHEARRATVDEISRVHKRAYVEAILKAIPKEGFLRIDADTGVSPGSGEAALRAAGALVDAVDHVARGELKNAFCAVRPPGHHAEPARAMGFCLFNNIAVGALHAREAHGHRRIAVVDFDVHHGNGTQAMFERDADLFFASTHQSPLYPGTGDEDERGVAGNILNAPLPPRAGSAEFRTVMSETVLPAVEKFAPDFIFISAGFDAHQLDPLANLRLTEEDYGWVTGEVCKIAEKHCDGRVVSTLEGGYNLEALAESAKAHVRALMNG